MIQSTENIAMFTRIDSLPTMMKDFTPVSGFVGRLLIGLAIVLLLLVNGHLAEISGILGGLLASRGADKGWRRALFIAGLLLGVFAYVLATGDLSLRVEATLPVLVVAGLLVGFGTRLGSGCTSGHGLCGIAHLSKRSVFAPSMFFGVAIATAFLVHHVLG
jgi:uncharacterized membrane protein YedE/YeeE